MEKYFDEYVNQYNLQIPEIKIKYDHSYRVMNLNEKYAKLLNFSKEDIQLAKLIGLLHDIGRFEQFTKYHSYVDLNTVDHADYGVIQLFDEKLITKFTTNKNDYDIIKFAIKNHNKLSIPPTENKRALMHTKLIRDTDKVDIIYYLGRLKEHNYKADNTSLSKEVVEDIQNHRVIDRKNVKTNNDNIAIAFAFAFDVYNDIALEDMKRNLKYYYEQIEDCYGIFKDIYLEVNKYINDRLNERRNENVR